jgi:uncharacterized protein (TIGR02118 family)
MAIRLSVYYPRTEGASFDHEYYRDKHVPLCCDTWRPDRAEIDMGVEGPYIAAVHFLFESPAVMREALENPDTAKIVADVANYTTIAPVRQVSEVIA